MVRGTRSHPKSPFLGGSLRRDRSIDDHGGFAVSEIWKDDLSSGKLRLETTAPVIQQPNRLLACRANGPKASHRQSELPWIDICEMTTQKRANVRFAILKT